MRVPAVCAAPKVSEKIADQHVGPQPSSTKGCESRRRLVRIVPPIFGTWHCFTHTSCICNDTIACVNRVIGRVPLPTTAGVKEVEAVIYKLWPYRHLKPLSLEEALATFKGTKNKLYKRAYDSLVVEPISNRDARIKAFVKAERFNPSEKNNPDPRMIQARSPRYNLNLARYLRGIEHHIYGLKQRGMPVIVKCMNPRQRAQLIREKWFAFNDPVCLSLDCSRWDKHVSKSMLKVEHRFYKSFYPGEVELDKLLKWQERNECITSNGVKYVVDGGRMSGDMNTASGNCLLMVGKIVAAMKRLGIKVYSIVDDGDDGLLLIERSDLERVLRELPGIFLDYGQELKIENIAYALQEIIFCQCKMTWNGTEWTMARDWRKVLSHSCCGTKHWNDPHMVRPMFGLLGDCENALHGGIPILQVFASRLRQLSTGKRARIQHMDSSYQYRIASYKLDDILELLERPITAEARFQFEVTWGLDPSTQMAIEAHIREWNPNVHCRDVGPELVAWDWVQKLDPGLCNPTTL